jgi:hypothetical protein
MKNMNYYRNDYSPSDFGVPSSKYKNAQQDYAKIMHKIDQIKKIKTTDRRSRSQARRSVIPRSP